MSDNALREQLQAIREGIANLITLGEFDQAQAVIEEYRRAVGPLDPDAYVLQAELSLSRGEQARALRHLEMGLIADWHNADLLYSLGNLYFSTGHEGFQRAYFEDAAFCYARALPGCTGEREKLILENLRTIETYRQEARLVDVAVEENPLPSLTQSAGFLERLLRSIFDHSYCYYPYNLDLEHAKNRGMRPGEIALVNPSVERQAILRHLQGIERLDQLLADGASRELLVTLLTYRILGNWKVKLPTDTPDYWAMRATARSLARPQSLHLESSDRWLSLLDLEEAGFRLRMFDAPHQICATFLVKQYEHGTLVRPEPGDVVLDCGGCWGDTALYFAHEVGTEGQVHSFEFIPSNLEVFRRNMGLNPDMQDCIRVVERPLWERSGLPMRYVDEGVASRVTFGNRGEGETVCTLSIDDYVQQAGLRKIDFIKMDIEGAEVPALKGAVETIRTRRPKLAITIYHQVSDFSDVVSFLNDLDLGYEFYLGHFTTYYGETVLFAVPPRAGQ
ncbi:MAG: FkbM family methyltransferase [Methanocella sp.]